MSFNLLTFPVSQTIVLGKRESCNHSQFISLDPQSKALEFLEVAVRYLGQPIIELFSCACAQHACKLLDQLIGQIGLWVKLPEQQERFLFFGLQFVRLTQKQEGCLS